MSYSKDMSVILYVALVFDDLITVIVEHKFIT